MQMQTNDDVKKLNISIEIVTKWSRQRNMSFRNCPNRLDFVYIPVFVVNWKTFKRVLSSTCFKNQAVFCFNQFSCGRLCIFQTIGFLISALPFHFNTSFLPQRKCITWTIKVLKKVRTIRSFLWKRKYCDQ